MTNPPFKEFPKIARLSREVIVTEKLDGTNAQIYITDDGDFLVGSRSRWITPKQDNYGFARWAYGNRQELMKLGPGRHLGEWWGNGIQRGYGLKEKRFSLFNVTRWCLHGAQPQQIPTADPRNIKLQEEPPEFCSLVPVLYRGPFDTAVIENVFINLAFTGSQAAPGWQNPEGIVVFHIAGNVGFKKTFGGDGAKGK